MKTLSNFSLFCVLTLIVAILFGAINLFDHFYGKREGMLSSVQVLDVDIAPGSLRVAGGTIEQQLNAMKTVAEMRRSTFYLYPYISECLKMESKTPDCEKNLSLLKEVIELNRLADEQKDESFEVIKGWLEEMVVRRPVD